MHSLTDPTPLLSPLCARPVLGNCTWARAVRSPEWEPSLPMTVSFMLRLQGSTACHTQPRMTQASHEIR